LRGGDNRGRPETDTGMTTSLAKARRPKITPAAAKPLRLGALADFIGFHLRLAQEASFQAFAHRVRDLDLRPGRFAVLALIGENPGISQTALGRASGRDKSSLTPALDDLAGRGLIRRRRVARDRRSYALSLTPKGERLLATLLTQARAHDRRLDAIVGLRHKAEFIGVLRRIAMALV
jgi:DNA-binding MarR family transcriptional regulator